MAKSRTRISASIGGLLTILSILVLGSYWELSFSAHMALHMLITYVLAPLMILSQFFLWWLTGSPRSRLERFLHPISSVFTSLADPLYAFDLSTVALWLWHSPYLFDLAEGNDTLHALQHITLFVSYLLYWSPLLQWPSQPARLTSNEGKTLYLTSSATQSGFLGGIITLSDQVIYSQYLEVPHLWGLSALQDQQLGGVIMWVGGSIIFIVAAFLILRNK